MNILKNVMIFIIFNTFKLIFSQITFNFKQKNDISNANINTLYQILYDIQLETNIQIGNPIQNIPILIELQTYYFLISNNEMDGSFIKYNPSKSNSYINNKEISLYSENFELTNSSNENFIIGNELKKGEKLDFICVRKGKYNKSGTLGLKIKIENKGVTNYNIIYQLKEKKLINSYIFYIQYTSESEGKLIIGNYPHNYNKKLFKEEHLKYTKEIIDGETRFYIKFDKMIAGNETFTERLEGYFEMENGLIRGTVFYHDYLRTNFFNEKIKNDYCKVQNFKDNIGWTHEYYVCDEDKIDLKNFPDLKFILNDINMTFTFNADELFYKFKGKLYFLIYFTNSYRIEWIFGKPFLKKYITVFDQDKKLIGFYENIIEKGNNYLKYYLIAFICFILGIFIGIFYYKNYKKQRKIRANELEDNFIYEPYENKNENGKNENKKILGI